MQIQMQEIWEPAITIPLRHFRDHPVDWYATINENKNGDLYKKAQELKDACGYKWGNGIYRVSVNGMTGSYHLYKDSRKGIHNLWHFTIYHDKWGGVFNESFNPDSDNKIPQDVLNRASKKLGRVVNGYVTCFDCKKEVAYTDSFGTYYDIRYCSKECSEKNAARDRDRSR